jgi:GNAT superfamily N-acetyltransferase
VGNRAKHSEELVKEWCHETCFEIAKVSDVAVTLRRVQEEDWNGLRAIRLEALFDTPEAFGSTYDDAILFNEDRWRTMAREHCYFLAERDGAVVGMISGGLNDGHPGTRWMYGMYVTPPYRGSGVANALVDAVCEWAKSEGVDKLFLHVTSAVPRARAFYTKIGFILTGDSFLMPRDASLELLTMEKSLVNR